MVAAIGSIRSAFTSRLGYDAIRMSSTVITVAVTLAFVHHVSGLTCIDVRRAGSGSKFSMEELESLSDEDFMSCLVYLGRDPLGFQEGKFLWEKLNAIYENDMWNIPEGDLRQLGWIMKAITPKEMRNLTLSDIDTITAFGQYHNLSIIQLQALAERVREDWNAKDPTDYTFYDLMALNHILCGFNGTDLAVIHPDSYKEAAVVLSTLTDCSRESLQALATLAVSPAAFDDPSTWYSSQVRSVGCVMNGMSRDDITVIPAEGFETLTPEVIRCFTRETLTSMTVYQLKHLTPSAAAALSQSQKSYLDFDQQKSVNEAYGGETQKTNTKSNASAIFLASIAGLVVFIVHVTTGLRDPR